MIELYKKESKFMIAKENISSQGKELSRQNEKETVLLQVDMMQVLQVSNWPQQPSMVSRKKLNTGAAHENEAKLLYIQVFAPLETMDGIVKLCTLMQTLIKQRFINI